MKYWFIIFSVDAIAYTQLSLISLGGLAGFGEGPTTRLQASVLVQAPQLPVPTGPVGKDKSILMVLHQFLAGEGQREEAARVRGRQQGGGEHHRGLADEIVAGEGVLVPHLELQLDTLLRRFHGEGEGALGWVVDGVLVVLPHFCLLLVPATNDLNIRIALPGTIDIRQVRRTEHPDHKGSSSHPGGKGYQGNGFGSHPDASGFLL